MVMRATSYQKEEPNGPFSFLEKTYNHNSLMNAISCSFTHKRLRFKSAAKTLSDRDAILFEDNSLTKTVIFGN